MTTGVLVAVGAAPFESAVLDAAQRDGLHVVRRCVDVPDLLASAATGQAVVALVASSFGGLDADVVARLADENVVAVGVVGGHGDPDLPWLTALGVGSVIELGGLGELPAVVAAALRADERADAETAPNDAADAPDRPRQVGSVVAVWGPTGAPGRSVVAQAMAARFAQTGLSTLLVDADVYGGAQAHLLGMLDESSGLLAAARAANAGRLDVATLGRHALEVSPGLRVLTGLPRSDRWVELSPVLLTRVLDAGRLLTRLCVVDCAFCLELDEEVSYDTAVPRRNGATLSALEQADAVMVVGAADPVGLVRLLRALADLRERVPDVTPLVVVNRMRPTLGWSAEEVADVVRRTSQVEVAAFLPDDQASCDRAVVRGQALVECAPASRLTRAVQPLAERIAAELGVSLPGSRAGRRALPIGRRKVARGASG